jgi:hypothetical protein
LQYVNYRENMALWYSKTIKIIINNCIKHIIAYQYHTREAYKTPIIVASLILQSYTLPQRDNKNSAFFLKNI